VGRPRADVLQAMKDNVKTARQLGIEAMDD